MLRVEEVCSMDREFISIEISIIHIGTRIFSTKLFHYLVHTLGEPMISMVSKDNIERLFFFLYSK